MEYLSWKMNLLEDWEMKYDKYDRLIRKYSDYILDEILDELCSYVDPYLTPDDVFRSSNI